MSQTLLNNRYKVLRVLGSGGFGETFLAEDTQMPSSRRCVIKQLKPVADNPQVYQLVQQRFQQEAAILEELGDRSNQIPRLYAYFVDNGQFYLVQEYIEGQTLTQKLQQGLLSEDAVRDILSNILPILDFVHSKRMVHRDIKPDNIILRFSDGKPILIDFGAVKVTMQTEMSPSAYAQPSIVIGTPGFMPQEQSLGRPVFSSDLYSLGLTAIYLLSGRIPQQLAFDTNTGEILWRHFNHNLNPAFADVLDKAIRKSPRDRFMSAKEMLSALQLAFAPIAPTILPTPPIPQTPPTFKTAPVPSIPIQQLTVPVGQPAPIPYQHQVASPQIPVPKNGLAPWQQGVIIGGVIGSCVVSGLWLLRGQTPAPSPSVATTTQTDSTSTSSDIAPTSIQTKSNSSSKSLSSNSGSKSTSTKSNSSSTTTSNSGSDTKSDNSSTSPKIDSQNSQPIDTSSPTTSNITEGEAKNTINKWLQAKRVMFSPPYDAQPAAELTTGTQYEQVAGANGSINALKNDRQYYKYGTQTVDSIEDFSVNGNQAAIQVKVTEDRTLFNSDGTVIPKETDFKTRVVRYNLQLIDNRWKIASTEIISN
jgi:serine/threonine protein kinase